MLGTQSFDLSCHLSQREPKARHQRPHRRPLSLPNDDETREDVPLVGLAVLFVLGTLVQVRVPSETFTTITLGDFYWGDATFLPFVHVPPDRTVDIPGLRTGKGSQGIGGQHTPMIG